VKDRTKEQAPSSMPETAQQGGEIRTRWVWVEPTVWTERALATLETGIEGRKWHRLINEEELITGSSNPYFSAVGLFSLKQAYAAACRSSRKLTTNWRAEMQENCQSGSEGGAKSTFVPTPIKAKRMAITLSLYVSIPIDLAPLRARCWG
jgi:hypothetical protein